MSGPGAARELRVGISSCLVGNAVRYDGGHKRDDLLASLLAPHVTFVPICPEVEVGMGTPRPPIRLVRRGGELRLVEPVLGTDHTAAMRGWAAARLDALEAEEISGFVLKSASPSCGLAEVEVWEGRPGAPPLRSGRGLFAEALLRRFPQLPVEEEGRLHAPALVQRFLARARAYREARGRAGALRTSMGCDPGVARRRARR